MEHKVALVTGASSGIGLETAKLLFIKGYKVYGLCRRPFSHEGITYLNADVTDKAAVAAAIDEISARENRLDLLINNAGFGISGAAELTAENDARAQFDVNFFGVLFCIQCALPLLRKSRGRIVSISSVAAFIALPFQSFYSCTKAAVSSLTLSLGSELKPFGVSVAAVCLGDVKSGFTAARKKQPDDPIYGARVSRSLAVMERDEQNGMTAEKAAKSIAAIAGKKRVKPLYTVGFTYKLIAILSKILPARLIQKIVAGIYAK